MVIGCVRNLSLQVYVYRLWQLKELLFYRAAILVVSYKFPNKSQLMVRSSSLLWFIELIPPRQPCNQSWTVAFFVFNLHSSSLFLHSAKMHLSIGNIVAILSLIIAIPCTAILLWNVFRRQQRGSHNPRTFLKASPVLDQNSDWCKIILTWCRCINDLVGALQALYRASVCSRVSFLKLGF